MEYSKVQQSINDVVGDNVEKKLAQLFPKEWIFVETTSAKYKQIGNAVLVGLAEAIGRAIIATADKTSMIKTKRFRGTDIHN